MLFKLINKNGAILKTKNTYMPKDICIEIDEAVLGVKTDDATAEPVDIIAGKTAYVKGEKITGTLTDYTGNYTGNIAIGIHPEGNLEITSTEEVDVTNYATVSINEPNLKAENILKDVNILGITGTCRPYEEPKLQEKTVTQNGEVLPDEGYDGLSKVTVDLAEYEDRLKKFIDITGVCNYFFYKRTDLVTAADVSSYLSYSDTENARYMNSLFYECINLTSIPQLNTSNVISMDQTFMYCTKLTTIPQLDTSKVTDMRETFRDCSSLVSIPQLDTSSATNMNGTFEFCYNLTSIPQLNTSKVTDMQGMVDHCKNLTTIPQLNTSNVTDMGYMFRACHKLEHIDLTHYNISSTNNSSNIFAYCHSLKELIIRSFGDNYTINTNAFTDCYHLTGTTDSTYNPNGLKDCYIYVPRSVVDTLKAASGWSTYASQIRALEDYTVDGTTDGELDESKI